MTDPMTDQQSNSSTERLRSFVERVEQLNEEKAEVAAQIKEVLSEAKGEGYLVMAIRKIVAERKRSPDDLAEEQAVMDMYRAALGMS